MRNTKLYSALVRLNGFELNRLHRFLVSPYFNRNQSIIQLFELIKEDIKKPGERELTKEEIWQSIIRENEEFNDGRFRKLQSDLLSLIEKYYAQEAFEANPLHRAKYLLETIYNKDLKNLESSAIRTALKLTAEQKLKPASYYFYQYEIEQSQFNLQRFTTERSLKSNIEDIAQNLDRFYLAEKLRYYCTILDHQNLFDIDYKMLFIDAIIDHVEQNDYSDTPPILVYFQILLCYREPFNRSHFDNLKILIKKHILIFPEIEVAEILDSALNYCIKRMNAGEHDFVREAFVLYQDWVPKGLLQVRGRLTPFHFKNIVTAGLRVGEFEWVEHFIYNYNFSLEENQRHNAVTFNLAQLYFYRKDYSKVIKQLSQVEYEDITYNLNSKTLLMASYYEMDEIEALTSLLDTFRVYLSRNKNIPAIRRKHYLNTISIVRKLAKVAPGDVKEISRLEKEIESTQGIVSKNWIIEKLDALKGDVAG